MFQFAWHTNRLHRVARWTALCLVLAVFGFHASQYSSYFDDSYISYRYADNLASGLGFVYNPGGEVVEGFTCFLWVVLLALGRLLGVAPDVLGPWLSIVAGGLLVSATFCFKSRDSKYNLLGPIAAFFVATNASIAAYSATGMESSFFSLLMWSALLLVLWLAANHNHKYSMWLAPVSLGIILCLAAMTRPIGAIYAAVFIFILALKNDIRTTIYTGLAFLIPFSSYFSWRWVYFGNFFPNTYYAKLGGEPPIFLLYGVGYIEGFLWLHLGIVGVLGLVLATIRKQQWAGPMLAFSILAVILAIIQHGDIFPLHRFLMPVIPATSIGTAYLAVNFTPQNRRRFGALVLCAFIILFGVWQFGAPRFDSPQPLLGRIPLSGSHYERFMAATSITRSYEQIAAWMSRQYDSDSILAINAAGVIPYRTGMRTIDMLGLNDRHIAHTPYLLTPLTVRGHNKHDAQYVLSQRPDLIFIGLPHVFSTRPDENDLRRMWRASLLPGDEALLASPTFLESYQMVIAQIGVHAYTVLFVRR